MGAADMKADGKESVYLRVDQLECSETGALIDFVLRDSMGEVYFRIGPTRRHEHEKVRDLDNLGWKTGDLIRIERVDQ